MYIGLKDVVGDDKTSSFKWVGDNSAMSFTNWNGNEPSDGNEACTEMVMATGKWNDILCSIVHRAVCETAPVSHVNHMSQKKN